MDENTLRERIRAARDFVKPYAEEEFIFYAMPVGTVSEQDKEEEEDFYRFVKEDGL